MNRRSASLLVDSASNTDHPDLPVPIMVDNMGFVGYNETDYVPSERLMVNGDKTRNQPQLVEVEDEDAPGRYAEDYNLADAAHILGQTQSPFEMMKEDQNNAGLGDKPWAPFDDEDEWELAKFLIKEVSQTAANKYLKLPIVSGGLLW
jgi:hypothetical protein